MKATIIFLAANIGLATVKFCTAGGWELLPWLNGLCIGLGVMELCHRIALKVEEG